MAWESLGNCCRPVLACPLVETLVITLPEELSKEQVRWDAGGLALGLLA